MNFVDLRGRPIVVVTGMGVVTPLGVGKAENWAKLTAGQSGIRQIRRFSTEGLQTQFGGTVDFVLPPGFTPPELSFALAEIAAEEAIEQAAVREDGAFPGPLFIAVPPVEVDWSSREKLSADLPADAPVTYRALLESSFGRRPEFQRLFLLGGVADRVADRFRTRGSPVSISTACASGASAIQMGVEAIRRGEASVALSIGTDGSINGESLIRFSLLSALSTRNEAPEEASRPFSRNRDGFVMAEGSGALVLESLASAVARDATILGVIAGCGERADSFHRTRSNPDGTAIIGAMQGALDDAGMAPEDIDYINAHGTGTQENDKMESFACAAVFGERMTRLPISSNKSMIGHTLTAAGAVEAIFSLMTIQRGLLPPTINYRNPDPLIPLDVVPNVARPAEVRTAMSNSFGFGGQNVCLVFQAAP
ncbi:MAG TPA: beta-ketoacyl-ACP synthase [Roseiarcus sp.]|nr:beta-ketoacyl-ACP synthase [Roseiarcus sp.]